VRPGGVDEPLSAASIFGRRVRTTARWDRDEATMLAGLKDDNGDAATATAGAG